MTPRIMSTRTVKLELEAKLTSGAGGLFSKPGDTLERKTYEDFGQRFRISVRNLDVPENSTALVTAGSVEIARFPVQTGRGRLDTETLD